MLRLNANLKDEYIQFLPLSLLPILVLILNLSFRHFELVFEFIIHDVMLNYLNYLMNLKLIIVAFSQLPLNIYYNELLYNYL